MASAPDPYQDAPNPDKLALKRVGEAVRRRLDADPGAHRIPTDRAEIYGIQNFLSPAECQRMIDLIDSVARPSTLYDHGYTEEYRTSYSGDVDRSDSFVRMIERRIDDCLGMKPEFGETVQGQRYRVGQQFREHNDWFWTKGGYWEGEAERGGQRSWTTMVYLNEVEEGGTTDFTRIGLSVPPQPGVLLVWNNALPDGTPNPDTLHAGTPVIKGVKYVITKWYRTRRWG
ncbi:2OG-Fe(II) oxygenase [Novosphingobium sp. TH158]|uniref:prolyl hydroxylase family protein n=1 Tax=Novosphingobium sp. TH158 TaxID=2067455 RepID=UPI000C7C3569|nr:2OG-Fe(II) oxygenase [Novosphingobium sp. TH158]PLK25627.1 2OG-Fe(II) oxygenase [Novosphingobium sp. TH158]